jgi:hypothetical protein
MDAFLLKEYEKLRDEIMFTLKEMVELENYAMVITAAVWAWVLGSGPKSVGPYFYAVYWIPTILVCMLKVKRNFLERHILIMAGQIRRTEERLLGAEGVGLGFGWEHRPQTETLVLWVRYYWIFLIASNLGMSLWFTTKG